MFSDFYRLNAKFTEAQSAYYSTDITHYSTGFKYIEKITATATLPHRTVFKYIEIFINIAHSLNTGETPSISASHQASNYVQRS